MKAFKVIILCIVILIVLIAAGLFLFGGDFIYEKLSDNADEKALSGDYKAAQLRYELINRLWPEATEGYQSLGVLYLLQEGYTSAEAVLNEAIEKHPWEAEYYKLLSRAYVRQDKLLDAAALLDTIENPEAAAAIEALRPPAVEFYPRPGKYTQNISVTMFAPADCVCYYSSDGSYPSISGERYAQALETQEGENSYLALAVSAEGLAGRLCEAVYEVESVIFTVELKDLTLDKIVRELLGKTGQEPLWTDELWAIESLSTVNAQGESFGSVLRLDDLKWFSGLTTLYMEGQRGLELSQLAQLPALRNLTLTDCALTAQDIVHLGELEQLEQLNLSLNRIASAASLGRLTALLSLDLSGNSLSSVEGLEGLAALEYLDLTDNAVQDISPLRGLGSLRELRGDNLLIEDLSPLGQARELRILSLENCRIADLSPLGALPALERVNLVGNQIQDISPLGLCPALAAAYLDRNLIADASGIEGASALEALSLSHNALTQLPEGLGALKRLRELNISYCPVRDLGPAGELDALEYLDMEYSEAEDLSPLLSCGALKTVMAFGAPLADKGGLDDRGVTVYWNVVTDP